MATLSITLPDNMKAYLDSQAAAAGFASVSEYVQSLIREAIQRDRDNIRTSNQAMLNALAKVEEIQKAMQPRDDKNTLDYLREARSGGMYGHSPNE